MKKALAVLVLLAAFSVCTPVFADYVLEYGLTIPMKGVDADNNNLAENIPIKGFLVMTISSADGSLVDANLIIYGADPNKNKSLKKVFTQLNQSDANAYLLPTVTTLGNNIAIDLFANDPFGFEMLMIGKTKLVNVGTGVGVTETVAPILKGVIWMPLGGLLISQTEDIFATGNANAVLLAGPTKLLNLGPLTQDNAVDVLRTTKLNRYTEIVIDPNLIE